MTEIGSWVVAGCGVLAALVAAYLAVLALAALFYRPRERTSVAPAPRLAVIVPAHDEAVYIERCLSSLFAQDYDRQYYDVIVVADNCTDETPALAAAAGARVLVRDQPDARGKGYALRWAIDRVLDGPQPPDGVVVVDADSVTDSNLLSALGQRLQGGADAVQAEYLALRDEHSSTRSELRALAFLLFHRVRFTGRSVLGLPCALVGNGMLLSRRLLEVVPWSAFSRTEDLEYSVDLRLRGIGPVFAPETAVRGPVASQGPGARIQRQRWEGGRLHVARFRLPSLVRAIVVDRRLSLADAALDLVTPPLGILASGLAAGTTVSFVAVLAAGAGVWVTAPWLTGLAAVLVFGLAGMHAGRAPRSMYRALAGAPGLVLRDLMVRVGLVGRAAPGWVRTARPEVSGHVLPRDEAAAGGTSGNRLPPPTPVAPSAPRTPAEPGRIDVVGVPIDPLDMGEAVSRAMQAVRLGTFMQVCTVNLDFLVNAKRQAAVTDVLRSSSLNLADGMPVIWLARVLGKRIPERIAGADFVPQLLRAAAEERARVFFLGGENGVASCAAQRFLVENPGLELAGVYEPARSTLEDMDTEAIFDSIIAAKPDILLVALGHPKQDRWIYNNRNRLPVSVAIGVGCTLDLAAGRSRAPLWMRRSGLEWLYRVSHESRLILRYATDACWLLAVFLPMSVGARLRRASA